MITQVRGSVPKLPFDYAKVLINRAWRDLRRQNLWSFQLYNSQWIAPPLVNSGTASVTQGSLSVTLNATAKAAFNTSISSFSYSTAIQREFRVGAYGIYQIYAYNSSTGVITLDRPYGESTSATAAYSIFQNYYAAPYADHLTFISVRDMFNFIDLNIDKTRAQIDAADPQRTWYYFPTDVVFFQDDQNSASSTYKFPLYELWGLPTYNLTWQLYGIRKLTDFTALTDTLPNAIGEDCLISLALSYAYQWAEANKGAIPRNQGPDFKFLIKEAESQYSRLYKEYRRQDRETVNNWFFVRRPSLYGKVYSYYSTFSNTAFPGIAWPG